MINDFRGYFPGKRIGVYDLDGCIVDSSARLKKHVDSAALANGDLSKYTHSFYNYGQTTEGDVPIVRGIMLVDALAKIYNVDILVALTSRGETGRSATEQWLSSNLPWRTGGELLIMHRERHYGRGVETLEFMLNENQLGYIPSLSGRTQQDVRWENDVWFLEALPGELFSPSDYKRAILQQMLLYSDVAFAIDDHPGIVEMYAELGGFDALRCVWDNVDCLTPAGDLRVLVSK